MPRAALLRASYSLFHVPDLVRYGSKPTRQIRLDSGALEQIEAHRRPYRSTVAYPPNQVFIGNLAPNALDQIERPWYRQPMESASETGTFGRIYDQAAFYNGLKEADAFSLVHLGDTKVPENGLPLFEDQQVIGWVQQGYPGDDSQIPQLILENLACKTTAVAAARQVLDRLDPNGVEYVLNTGEEAIGDRYQRGGGNLAKAVAESVGSDYATGADIKAFCCAPAHALIMGAALIESGLYRSVMVIGGGSMAKLGMKFEGHVRHDMPVLEDVLAGMAFLLGPADGQSPTINLESVGRHTVAAGATPQAIYAALVAEPLRKLGLRFDDVDKYAVELHDPEVTEPSGSGNVPLVNYRAIAALAVMRKEMPASAIPDFVREHGMPGFAPTQGHIPSGVPYLGHAREAMLAGTMKRTMVVAKGSLFLGKMTQLADGMSFMMEAACG